MTSKTVLVTGASSGIGRATARTFQAAGWTVYAGTRDSSGLEGLAAEGCEVVTLDVRDQAACASAVDEIVSEHGRVDCLINNAGFAQWGPMEDVSAGRLERQLDVNCLGPHRLSRLVLPQMRKHGDGTIVNVSSVLGSLSVPGYGAYSASKHALEAISDAMRAEVEPFGVDVVIVAPGPVDTNFRTRAMADLRALDRSPGYGDIYEYFEDRAVTADIGTDSPDTVAEAILAAASSDSPPARLPVGRVAAIGGYASHLPPGLRDFAFRIVRRVLS